MEDGSEEEFLRRARDTKRRNYEIVMELAQENGILDNLVARLIPDAEWVNCWWDVAGSAIGSAGSPVRLIPSHTSTRTRRVLEVAEDRNYDGESTVTSKGIAEQFRNS